MQVGPFVFGHHQGVEDLRKPLHTYFFLRRKFNGKVVVFDRCLHFWWPVSGSNFENFFFSQASMWLVSTQTGPSYLLKVVFFNVLIVSLPIGVNIKDSMSGFPYKIRSLTL